MWLPVGQSCGFWLCLAVGDFAPAPTAPGRHFGDRSGYPGRLSPCPSGAAIGRPEPVPAGCGSTVAHNGCSAVRPEADARFRCAPGLRAQGTGLLAAGAAPARQLPRPSVRRGNYQRRLANEYRSDADPAGSSASGAALDDRPGFVAGGPQESHRFSSSASLGLPYGLGRAPFPGWLAPISRFETPSNSLLTPA